MNTTALYEYTAMVLETAEQLAGYEGATLDDIITASHMVWRWNTARIAAGLEPFK